MTSDEEYREKMLISALDSAESACNVTIAGLGKSLEDICLLRVYLGEIITAINNLKSGNYLISMREYKKMKDEIVSLERIIIDKNNSILKMKMFLKERRKEAETIRESLKILHEASRKGIVLPFGSRRDGK